MENDEDERRSRKKDMLKMYYGVNGADSNTAVGNDPLDIDSPHFHAENYLRKIKQEKSLAELMDAENDMAKQIRTLDSEMQTLVYENYNKFISATDTIRNMKRDFRQMENEMEKLTTNMSSITELNSEINETLKENRQKISKLSGVHSLLKKLQFLFELPAKLQKCLETGAFSTAVSYYMKTKSVLQHYQHMESFSGIERDCQAIINEIVAKLKQTFHDKHSSAQQLAECVGLLLRLGEPPGLLCDEYLQHSRHKLDEDLQELESYLVEEGVAIKSENSNSSHHLLIDVLEFIDRGSNGFLSNLSLTIAAYENLFIKQTEITSMTAALDGTYSPMMQSEEVCKVASNKLMSFVEELLNSYFHLVEKRLMLDRRSRDNALVVRALDRFYRRSMTYFGHEFSSHDVREVIIVSFLRYISESLLKFCDRSGGPRSGTPPPALLLLLSRLCRDFEQNTVAYVLTLTDEQFVIASKDRKTEVTSLTAEMGKTAQQLLEGFVHQSGVSVSRMIRTSIEARDWLRSVEPRQVRAVMRRVVEEITQTDQQVGSLYEEGIRKARSSDSSKRTHPFNQSSVSRQRDRSHWGAYAASSTMDNSLLSNIQKLFSERVDVFGAVEFSKTSIMTGIVKIALKTLLECVRLKTFGKFGLQQLQVDCHYLQLYLWRFVADENVVHGLLDEVVSSCVHRCVEPVAMEPSVIDVICERG
nr:vacuolar protein sorting-associated protein 51 homolog [Ciona intestinalis]|eukprot:XP_026689475.1 vacuolar protein sorting-associated protein 51 homolog [Ciona intestinalis]